MPKASRTFPLQRERPSKSRTNFGRKNFSGASAFSFPLAAAADSYLVKRGSGKTIIAGYPWFGDWGRDTFISLRGLCLAADHLETARDILAEWAGTVSMGMLPNRFPDRGVEPEFNSVDASLWYIIAVFEYLRASHGKPELEEDDVTAKLQEAIEAILSGYSKGTRFGIRADEDGLLAAGEPGVQLTWMDAKVGEQVITPRIGKPVEVQALWINALWIGQSVLFAVEAILCESIPELLPFAFGMRREGSSTM